MFAITGSESSHRCGGILAHSSLQNCFNSATLEGFQAWKDSLRSCHSISIGFKSRLWLGHSKTLILFFLSHSEVDLLVCLGSLSCCITQVRLSLRSQTDGPDILLQDFLIRVQNSWFHQLWQVTQVLKLQSSPRPSHYLHHVWLLVWCSFYEMLCWFYARCNGTHTFQKVQLLSHQSTEYLPKSLGDHQDIFWQMWNEPLCSFWSAVAFALELSHGCLFAQSLSYCWIMNTDLNWGYWGLQFFRCCSGFFYDLLDESSLCSWSNFGRPATPGKFTTVPSFLHLWIMALTVVCWSPKALEMAL